MSKSMERKRTRSRSGCSHCKRNKVKCSETKPKCRRCETLGIKCDYSLKLRWDSSLSKSATITATALSSSTMTGKGSVTPYPVSKPQSFSFINTTCVPKCVSNCSNSTTSIETTPELDSDTSTDVEEKAQHDSEDSPFVTTTEAAQLIVIRKPLMPLPDILLNNEYYYECFRFFCKYTSTMLVAEGNYLENPFQKFLPKLAVAHDSILCLVLAFGSCHRASAMGIEQPLSIINNLRSRSLQSMKQVMAVNTAGRGNQQDNDILLAIFILLGSFDIFSANETGAWKRHITCAKRILKEQGITFKQIYRKFVDPREQTLASDMSIFFFSWLGYVGIISFLGSPHLSAEITTTQSSYSMADITEITSQIDTIVIDPFLGFDIRLLPLFEGILQLIKEMHTRPHSEVIERALLIEHAIKRIHAFSARERLRNRSTALYSMNLMTCYNALLVLYRRVLQIERKSPLVQDLCHNIKQEFEENVIPGSSSETCSMFYIFTAAAESVDESLRVFFDNRFSKIISLTNPCVGKRALDIIHKTWETGNNWTDVATELMATNLTFT